MVARTATIPCIMTRAVLACRIHSNQKGRRPGPQRGRPVDLRHRRSATSRGVVILNCSVMSPGSGLVGPFLLPEP